MIKCVQISLWTGGNADEELIILVTFQTVNSRSRHVSFHRSEERLVARNAECASYYILTLYDTWSKTKKEPLHGIVQKWCAVLGLCAKLFLGGGQLQMQSYWLVSREEYPAITHIITGKHSFIFHSSFPDSKVYILRNSLWVGSDTNQAQKNLCWALLNKLRC